MARLVRFIFARLINKHIWVWIRNIILQCTELLQFPYGNAPSRVKKVFFM